MHRLKSLVCALSVVLGGSALASESTALAQPEPVAVVPPAAAAEKPAPAPAPEETAARADADVQVDAPDEPEIQQEVQEESAELEQVRAAEETARLSDADGSEDPAGRAASRLGLESPLRLRMRDAFGRDVGVAGPGGNIPGLPEIDHDLRRLQAEFDIPIEVNEHVVSYVRFFQTPLVRKHFVKWLGRSFKYIPVFRKILRESGLPEDTVYLAMIESGFANHAASRAKAVGAWQFIAPTGKRMGLRQDFWVDERRDPEKAARAAAKYLNELYRQTGDWRLAWAGYNAGVGMIYKARARGQSDFWTMTRGRVLKGETKGYVPKLMAAAIISKHAQAFGFTREEIQPEAWQDYEEVDVSRATPLAAVAKAAEVDEKDLQDLNPELRRSCTPPRTYAIKVPRGKGEVFARNWPAVSESAGELAFSQHKVRPGESIAAIAKANGVDQATLARMNGLRVGRHVKPGTELVIPTNALARTQSVAFARAEPPPPPERVARKRAGHKLARADRAARPTADVAGRARSTVHVRAGDTLWSISQRLGVALEELCRWNGIRNPRNLKLQVGRALVVYARRGEAASAQAAPRVGAG